MLVLTLKEGNYVMIGEDICVRYVEDGSCGYIKIGIDAPKAYSISRDSIYEKKMEEQLEQTKINIEKLDERKLYSQKLKRKKEKAAI